MNFYSNFRLYCEKAKLVHTQVPDVRFTVIWSFVDKIN